jgi:hypothetical protein
MEVLNRIVSDILVFIILWNLPMFIGAPILNTIYAVIGALCLTGLIGHLIWGRDPATNTENIN